MRAWYVCQTKSNEEQTAEVHLIRQGYETYLPQTLADKRSKKNKYKNTIPLFPGYLFVCLSDQNDNWQPIQSTRGVISLIKFGNIPASVPAAIIEMLKKNQDAKGINHTFRTGYQKGDRIRMLNKPFDLIEAVVHSVASERIFIILDNMRTGSKVEVGYRDIEPIDA